MWEMNYIREYLMMNCFHFCDIRLSVISHWCGASRPFLIKLTYVKKNYMETLVNHNHSFHVYKEKQNTKKQSFTLNCHIKMMTDSRQFLHHWRKTNDSAVKYCAFNLKWWCVSMVWPHCEGPLLALNNVLMQMLLNSSLLPCPFVCRSS